MDNQLQSFLAEFLPKAKTTRKTLNNEIQELHRIVDLIFFKFSKQRINKADLENALESLGYEHKISSIGTDKQTGATITMRSAGKKRWTANINYFVDTTALSELKLVTKKLPATTGPGKLEINEKLNERLAEFFE